MGTSYVGIDFDDIFPATADTFSFKLARWLAAGEVLTAGTFTLAVASVAQGFARDSSPQTRVSGSAAIVADANGLNTTIAQLLTGLLPGNRYILSCVATTSLSNQKTPWSYVTCRPPA